MRKYAESDERKIRLDCKVREWTRSGLLDKSQQALIAPELTLELRRTNPFLRVILFGFTLLVLLAALAFFGVTTRLPEDGMALLCAFAGVLCFFIAEFLIGEYKLYRFGVEEAAAAGAALLPAVAAGMLTSSMRVEGNPEAPLMVAMIVGSFSALVVYLRFGFTYAAIASMICLTAVFFQTGISEMAARLIDCGLLSIIFIGTRSKHLQFGDEFPGDEYGVIQSIAWLGIYAFFNLQIASFTSHFSIPTYPRPFYWFTYAMTWILPALGLYLAIREKDRPLLDVNLLLTLITLATNKPYLGATRATWDPILLGVLLIAVAVILRRWLAKGEDSMRHGFTADRILTSDKRALSVVGTGSAALHSIGQIAPAPSDAFKGGEGRSGGAGASGTF